MPAVEYKTTHPKNRQQWRQWLQKNHASSPGIWMIYYKKESGKPRVTYDEAVEEALCFGWIDSLPKKLDDQRAMLKFTPRKPKSVWSKLNKNRIQELIERGLIMSPGMAAVELAKSNGSWDTLTASDESAETNKFPADLMTHFQKNKKACQNFENFSLSIRRQFLSWIDSAKRPETRKIRIAQTVKMSAAGKKPGPAGFKL